MHISRILVVTIFVVATFTKYVLETQRADSANIDATEWLWLMSVSFTYPTLIAFIAVEVLYLSKMKAC